MSLAQTAVGKRAAVRLIHEQTGGREIHNGGTFGIVQIDEVVALWCRITHTHVHPKLVVKKRLTDMGAERKRKEVSTHT